MNIFLLSWCLEECVKWYFKSHITKMPLETAQLLSTVWWCAEKETAISLEKKGRIYKSISNINHGSAIWARESLENYRWLCDLGMAMCKEFEHRRGKKHASEKIIAWCARKRAPKGIVSKGITPFYQAIPEDNLKNTDPVVAYRQLYVSDFKIRLAEWEAREEPDWYLPMRKEYLRKKNCEEPPAKKRKGTPPVN